MDRSIVWIGDLNGDPDSARSTGGKHLARLRDEVWQLPRATGPWSFYTGSRIDHVMASPRVQAVTAGA
jgi:endonuclease/exonuclease/phosphatase family metal-dependent hydrolase